MPPNRTPEYKQRLAEATEFYNNYPDAYTITWVATKYRVN